MTKEKRNYKEYFITPFLGGIFAFTFITYFFIKIDSFSTGLIIVFAGALVLSILIGSLLIIINKYFRPRTQNYFLNHKNIKSLENIELYFNDTMNCYFGTYRNYDVQVLCHFDKISLIETEYVINIFFEKTNSEKIKQIRRKELLNKNNLAEFFIQKAFTFKFFPPSGKKLTDSINNFIDLLEKYNLKPVRLKDLGEEFNNVA